MKYRYFAPAIVWALVILFVTSIPASSIPLSLRIGISNFDKVIHFLLFAVLGLLLALAFCRQPERTFLQKNPMIVAAALGLLLGTLTESLQHFFIASRSGELLDVAANLFGTIFGVFLYKQIANRNRKKNSKN